MPRGPQHHKAPRVITPALIRDALACIPPDLDRETWVRLGMAVKAELGAEGFDLWDAWSQQAQGYSATDARDTWRSIKAGGRVTVGTLFGIAKDHGFRFPDDAAEGMTPEALAEQERQHAERAAKREAAQAAEAEQYRRRAEKAARDAAELWADAADSGVSPYLARKGVQAHGVRILKDGTLLVPLRDEAGELHNLQRIAPQPPTDEEAARGLTEKRFLSGGRKRGLFHVVGQVLDAAAADSPLAPLRAHADLVLIAEGYATGATLHEASGRPCIVGFDAGNLAAVAEVLPARFPGARFLLCADDDTATEARSGKNPGRDGADKAARKLRALGCAAAVLLPRWPAERPEGASDFNDLAAAAGLAEVTRQLAAAADAPTLDDVRRPRRPRQAAQTAAGGPNGGADGSGRPGDDANAPAPADDAGADAGAVQAPAPGPGGRDPFMLDERGVWFIARDSNGDDRPPVWVCAPLHVTARTRDDAANGWGYLLEFSDPDGNPKTWAMPVALLSGEGAEWAARLADMGLEIAHGPASRNRVGQYIKTRHPAERATCTDRVGWHGGAYVLPSRCIGEAEGRRYVFQSEAGMDDTFRQRGELADWQASVAAPCAGNSRFVFAVSCAFAGALLLPAGVESGGFHFRSGSSQGKTSALRIAASVWGRPDYVKRWRTTDNALEATAVQHSDGLLILDEIAQLDAAKAGECAYMLANEQEKGRNTRGGLNRKQRTWRLLFLSSGEVSLSAHMAEAGKRVMAGQEVRMVDIPLDAGQGMGGVEALHGHATPGALVEAITGAAARCYGVAGRAWLEWACAHQAELSGRLAAMLAEGLERLMPHGCGEQVRRVARRFALVAAAGELAGAAGITGWPAGAAAEAAGRCFDDWLAARGHAGNGEDAAALAQVQAVLEKNGDALFTPLHRTHDDHRPNTALRMGFKRRVDEDGNPVKFDEASRYADDRAPLDQSDKFRSETEYLVLPEAWKNEVCKGRDPRAVAEMLKARGLLVHEKGRLTRTHRLPGIGPAKVYHIKAAIFMAEP
ncbi:MAG: DUF927 domain-containing protein [Roseateles sp.]|uniref:DUF927 domain-containing protein n=1 Tax=Roseateles sp. TaxID=1971397 RepID=UPI0039ED2040